MDTKINPDWRTSTVVAICQGMRVAQDFSAAPILADALQDAGCDDAELLIKLRTNTAYSVIVPLVARTYDAQVEESVDWLEDYAKDGNGPSFHPLFCAAVDVKDTESDDDYSGHSRWDEYLHFNGTDAHGPIAPEFWDHVQLVSGKLIPPEMRMAHFSCSC